MTKDSLIGKRIAAQLLPPLLLIFLFLSLLFSGDVVTGTKNALALCAQVILPTLFPFMVLSELLGQTLSQKAARKHNSTDLFSRFFGVSMTGMSAFLLGSLCGFPLGVKHARALFDSGAIDEEECARLLCFANNTGPAFVIAGVGALFGSFRTGLFLYLFQIVSALLVGLIFAKIPTKALVLKRGGPTSQHLSLVGAIRKSTTSALAVCGMVVFFSALSALLSAFFKNNNLLLFISPFLEVGGACAGAAEYRFAAPLVALLAASFAISFGGASVHMQAMLFFEDGRFPLPRYLAAKLLQGSLSCLFALLCFPIL